MAALWIRRRVSALCACGKRSDGDSSGVDLPIVSVLDEVVVVVGDNLENATATVYLTDFAAVLLDYTLKKRADLKNCLELDMV